MEVELSAASAAMIGVVDNGGGVGDDDLDVDDDLSIGAEVTCSEDNSHSSSSSEVSILEELLKAENGNGDALACLQAASRSPLFRRVSYEEMVHRAHYPESAGGVGGSGGVRGTLVTLTQWVLVLQEVYDDNSCGGDSDPIRFVHGRLPAVTNCVCARAEALVGAVRRLECRLNEEEEEDGDALLAAALQLQNDLRLHVSILISDPADEVRQKAAFMVEAAQAQRQFVADAADSLVRLLYKLMGVESCGRHVLREDGVIQDVNTNDNDALEEEDDTKENDEEMEVEPWPNVISASANPSCRKTGMTPNSRKRKPLSPKHNSSASSPSAPTPPHPPPPARCSAAAAPPSAFAPSSAAALIRPSKRPRKVSPHPAGAGDGAVAGGGGEDGSACRTRVLELLERNRKVARCDGLRQFVLWREALRASNGNKEGDEGFLFGE